MNIDELKFDEKGLVPAVVQEEDTGEVLLIGFMNADALRMTYDKGLVTFWSRTQGKLTQVENPLACMVRDTIFRLLPKRIALRELEKTASFEP